MTDKNKKNKKPISWYRKVLYYGTIAIIALCVVAIVIGYLEAKPAKEDSRQEKIIQTVVETKVVEKIVEKEIEVSEIDWDIFTVTAYTQHDTGCNNITSIGVDLNKRWTEYFTLAAVDPNVIPYGKTLYIELGKDKLIEAVAVDTGGAIVGKRIDLLVDSKEEAYKFGVQELEVGVVR